MQDVAAFRLERVVRDGNIERLRQFRIGVQRTPFRVLRGRRRVALALSCGEVTEFVSAPGLTASF